MRQLQTMCSQKHLDWILILENDRMSGGARGKEVLKIAKQKTNCYICVLVLPLEFLRPTVCRGARQGAAYMCVLILLYVSYMCPHTTIYASSCYNYTCVLMLQVRIKMLRSRDAVKAEKSKAERLRAAFIGSKVRMLTYSDVC